MDMPGRRGVPTMSVRVLSESLSFPKAGFPIFCLRNIDPACVLGTSWKRGLQLSLFRPPFTLWESRTSQDYSLQSITFPLPAGGKEEPQTCPMEEAEGCVSGGVSCLIVLPPLIIFNGV